MSFKYKDLAVPFAMALIGIYAVAFNVTEILMFMTSICVVMLVAHMINIIIHKDTIKRMKSHSER